ncbi:MAG: pilus assembly protein N-terminal domain-containing protein [Alphaproteobacteria bacterium]|nr:pilus assembly protein N-terminal domain-containing protein [Alphaproteobacteria bacterium]MBU6471958.1 pilus assembly protein N-terminal domain-containing protein [Alphaproteobacteria bacterium]MDE2013268.1 pilus assembly protein N-terminal domain-containing protein [Alphaproteobacteria bacterium]MDE2073221.1 pilus assembly protein N-terminal domain-containing protein [Alphaproteobacteria bacterium]MDE2353084.1 pilus assembly protein N-terminal domain-containing protein [Alphaproteobacteria
MRRATFFFASIAAVTAGFALPAMAGAINVPIDQARVVAFERPVTTVFVGNPTMADVTVIDPTHVFVLGKAFGTTNLIALDARGSVLINDALSVEGHVASTVTLDRGSEQYTYACASGRCEAAPLPGDAQGTYSSVMGENQNRQDMGTKAATVASATAQ